MCDEIFFYVLTLSFQFGGLFPQCVDTLAKIFIILTHAWSQKSQCISALRMSCLTLFSDLLRYTVGAFVYAWALAFAYELYYKSPDPFGGERFVFFSPTTELVTSASCV